ARVLRLAASPVGEPRARRRSPNLPDTGQKRLSVHRRGLDQSLQAGDHLEIQAAAVHSGARLEPAQYRLGDILDSQVRHAVCFPSMYPKWYRKGTLRTPAPEYPRVIQNQK